MCGICCVLFQGDDFSQGDLKEFPFVSARGPDLHGSETVQLHKKWKLYLAGYVLHLRGPNPTKQPLCSSDGDCIMWNGEIFGGIEVQSEENDTQVIFSQLLNTTSSQQILDTLDKVEGPWAFIFWQNKSKKLWFGRDRLGRRSLLWYLPSNETDSFSLSSVTTLLHESYEVPAVGIFCLDLSDMEDASRDLVLYPWKTARWPGTTDLIEDELNLKTYIYPTQYSNIHISVHKTDKLQTWIPSLNMELPSADFKPTNVANRTCSESLQDILQNNELMRKSAEQLTDILEKAVRKRVSNIPCVDCCQVAAASTEMADLTMNGSNNVKSDLGHKCVQHGDQRRAKVAILFSGGIDSAILTALADRCLPKDEPIDLLNVAFEIQPKGQPNTLKNTKHATRTEVKDKFGVPDRVTGYTALSELDPARCWNFVEINVTQEELKDVRSSRVRHLVYPSCTVLDDSIGCAIWFAARGKGIIGNGANKGQMFTSTARVILCGMGADEQLAGYSRHRTKFSEGSWEKLLQEIEMEIQRISARNLGRDDRIIGDHGKEARFPFLDETVVQHLSSLPIQIKAQLDLPRGLGEKLLLRLSAYQLALYNTSCFPKRAIQFGSRIAKMENSKEKSSEKCARLNHD